MNKKVTKQKSVNKIRAEGKNKVTKQKAVNKIKGRGQ